ncbi:MAG: PIN domain-containing protein [Candidatus Dormibacteraeota bacterium]|nr:PIN domain-containing protein [Candidatus Dormibacteraeota bacterium]
MSVTLDANILVYASNEADPVHAEARALLERLAAGPDLVYLFWPAVMGYLRIVTHPAILPHPLSPREAVSNVDALLGRPHVRVAGEAEGFWRLFRATSGNQARGNDVPDAHLATLMREQGVRSIYTRDRGFRRFAFVEVLDPFDRT